MWYVGNDAPKEISSFDSVLSVQAGGAELKHIEQTASGLPFCGNQIQTWFGDHAKWIVSNIVKAHIRQ